VGSETAKAKSMINSQWLPPTSQSLSRQLDDDNFSSNLIKSLSVKVPDESLINGESIIEMAHLEHMNEETKNMEE
jgi:hypothetical protein